ncbi:hypothetical protein GCM10027423_13070 [Spirosoma arcticum]
MGTLFAGDNKINVTLATSDSMQQLTMRKTSFIAFLSILTLFSVLTGCNKNKVAPVSERIAKVWTAQKVDESNITVYTRGVTPFVRNYAAFKLDLSAPPAVRFTNYDGITTAIGQYSLPSDNRLVLTGLTPQLTDVTNGTIEFTIDGISDTELRITRTSGDRKTGNTINKYTLTNP